MMFGIAKMPYELAMSDELSRRQYYENSQRLVAEIEALRESLAALRAENEKLREALEDADNELDWLDEEVDVCWYRDMRRKMKAALSKENIND